MQSAVGAHVDMRCAVDNRALRGVDDHRGHLAAPASMTSIVDVVTGVGPFQGLENTGSNGRVEAHFRSYGRVFSMAMVPLSPGLLNIIAPDGGVLGYSYYGPLTFQETWDGSAVDGGGVTGSVERLYDNHLRVAGLWVNGANPISFAYDNDGFMTGAGALTMSRHAQHGLLTGTTLGEVADSYGRNGFGEVTEYSASVDSTTVLEIDYERDQIGRIKRKTESVEGGSRVDTYYVYDDAGRLYRVCDDEPVDGECMSVRAEYEYDSNSNRTGGTNEVSGAITATYDSQDRLLTYNGATYTYTANGELALKTEGTDTTTYEYDALGNLRRVELPDGTKIDYLIDGQNRRIGKKVDDTLVQGFLYEDQLRPVAELDGNGNVVSRFVYFATRLLVNSQPAWDEFHNIPVLLVPVPVGHLLIATEGSILSRIMNSGIITYTRYVADVT